MGAVTALLHADRDASIGAMCVDSPFANLRQLMEELACGQHALLPLPAWLVNFLMSVIKERVKTLADFDIDDLVPVEHAKRSYVPALFLHGTKDTFVPQTHALQLFAAYAGRKELVLVDGDHNSKRGSDTVGGAVKFFLNSFGFNTPLEERPSRPSAPRTSSKQGSAESAPSAASVAREHSQKPKSARGPAGKDSQPEHITAAMQYYKERRYANMRFNDAVRNNALARERAARQLQAVTAAATASAAVSSKSTSASSSAAQRSRSADAATSTGRTRQELQTARAAAEGSEEDEEVQDILKSVSISRLRSSSAAKMQRSASWPRQNRHAVSSRRHLMAPKVFSRLMKKFHRLSDSGAPPALMRGTASMPASMSVSGKARCGGA